MAGVELATAYYSLVPSMAGTAAAVRGQSAALAPVWTGIGDDAGKGLKGGLLAGIGRMAAPIAGAFAAIGLGNLVSSAIETTFDSIDLASSAAEMTSAIGVLYGDAADEIESFADRSISALGLTRLESLGAAKDFGLFAKAAGLSGDEMALFATDLTTLAADMASFNDTSIEEAITAIGAGLRGESEPLRSFGVLLDDATLKARALEMGIYDGNGALSQQQRVLAAQAEIFAQTTAQQGDAVRTGDQLAGQQKRLAAAFEEAQIKLGTALLPAMTQFTAFANEKLVPIINDLVTQVGPVLGQALEEAGPAFADLLLAVAPLIPELVRLGTEALPPILSALVALSPVIVDFTSNTASMWSVVGGFFSFLSGDTSLQQTANNFLGLKGSAFDAFRGVLSAMQEGAAGIAAFARDAGGRVVQVVGFFQSMPAQIRGVFAGAGSWLASAGADIVQGLANGIRSAAARAVEAARQMAADVAAAAKNLLGIQSPSKLFEQYGIYVGQGFERGVTKITPRAVGAVSAMVAPPRAVAPAVAPTGGSNTWNITTPPNEDPRILARGIERELRMGLAG